MEQQPNANHLPHILVCDPTSSPSLPLLLPCSVFPPFHSYSSCGFLSSSLSLSSLPLFACSLLALLFLLPVFCHPFSFSVAVSSFALTSFSRDHSLHSSLLFSHNGPRRFALSRRPPAAETSRMDKPQILEHIQHGVNFTLFGGRWVPASARCVLFGQHARATGALQVYAMKGGALEECASVSNGGETQRRGQESLTPRQRLLARREKHFNPPLQASLASMRLLLSMLSVKGVNCSKRSQTCKKTERVSGRRTTRQGAGFLERS